MKKSAKFRALCKKYGVDPNNVPEVLGFSEACKITGDDPKKLPIVTGISKRHKKKIIADYKLTIIAQALRDNKDVSYISDKWKYFPVFKVKADAKRPSGFGLSYYDYDDWNSDTFVGVRLCFEDNLDAAIFFGKHFIDLHTDHHLYT